MFGFLNRSTNSKSDESDSTARFQRKLEELENKKNHIRSEIEKIDQCIEQKLDDLYKEY